MNIKGNVILLGVILIIAFIFHVSLLAQINFERTYGGPDEDWAYSVLQTSDGGYIMSGMTLSFGAGNSDAYLIKTDAHGDTLWTRAYGGPDYDEGFSVQQTNDGGYIIPGYTGGDVYLIKTDANGDTLWTRTYGGQEDDVGHFVQQTSDRGYIISGGTCSFGSGDCDVYLIKTDANGDTIWTRTYGGRWYDWGYCVQQTSDGGYIIAGSTWSFGAGGEDAYLIKADAQGDTLWTRTYGGTRKDWIISVQQTSDGGYIIAGETESFGAGGQDVYLIKTDANGDTLWTCTYGGSGDDRGESVQQTTDGGYIIAGATESFGAGELAAYLIKTDANGDTLWTCTYGGSDFDWGHSVQQTSDGGYIIAGGTESFGAGGQDVYLIKTDADGLTGVEEKYLNRFPGSFHLAQNYPNPFNPGTHIRYDLPKSTHVRIEIFNMLGHKIRTLVDEQKSAGSYTVVWDGRMDTGEPSASGVYIYRLKTKEVVKSRKLLLLR